MPSTKSAGFGGRQIWDPGLALAAGDWGQLLNLSEAPCASLQKGCWHLPWRCWWEELKQSQASLSISRLVHHEHPLLFFTLNLLRRLGGEGGGFSHTEVPGSTSWPFLLGVQSTLSVFPVHLLDLGKGAACPTTAPAPSAFHSRVASKQSPQHVKLINHSIVPYSLPLAPG